eukprot:3679208-Pyramimonas_sp.AAC.1
MFGARAGCVRRACARDSTHRETWSALTILFESQCPSLCLAGLRTAGHSPPPPPSLSKSLDSDRGVAAHDQDFAA